MIKRILLGIAVVLVLLVAWAGFEFVLTRGGTPSIEGEPAVAELTTVELGGAEQWVLIRGRDRGNPVLLWLHGGPGMPAMYLAHAFQREIERDFTVVHWDRLGAGKSYEAAGDRPISVRRRVDDTIELTERLRQRFGQERIYLLGHSWGSYLGLLAVRERPDLYRAFIGTGVIAGTRAAADSLRRHWITEQVRAAGDSALLARLANGGEVTEDDVFRHGGALRGEQSFWPLLRIGLAAPEYTLADALNVRRGVELVHERMEYDVSPAPLEGEVERVEIPVAFFLGRHDYTTPSALAAEYLERLEAPRKSLVRFEESAHFPFLSQPAEFGDALRELHRELSRP